MDRQPLRGEETISYAGRFDANARPRWRASGHLDENWPQFGFEFEPYDRRVAPVLYHDLEAGFAFDSGVTVRAAITNVTDEDPPYLNIAPANTDVATYRLLGRSYSLELRYQLQ